MVSGYIIESKSIPSGSLVLDGVLDAHNYVDRFSMALPDEPQLSVDVVATRLFLTQPRWVVALTKLRDGIVRPLGLRSSVRPVGAEPDGRLVPGQRLLFEVLNRSDEEVVLGERDRHLDFRVSVRQQRRAKGLVQIELTTVVWFRNALGRCYFAVIQPFHRLIVRDMMRRLAVTVTQGGAR